VRTERAERAEVDDLAAPGAPHHGSAGVRAGDLAAGGRELVARGAQVNAVRGVARPPGGLERVVDLQV